MGEAWAGDGVVYQVYPRSFQDSDGDGEGDLRGILARLDHVRDLGADALWTSPINVSPFRDGGYDVADYTAIAPRFGDLADLDALIAGAHERGLRLLLDLVPCHTSIEHPWFAEHPDRYIWSPVDGPPNDWRASFGGSAWSRDPRGRGWYLHSFYPEQPDLDWRNPAVVGAFTEILRFWRDRGVDGFRLDAIDRLLKDAQLRDEPAADGVRGVDFLPENPELDRFVHLYTRDQPDVGTALAQLRAGAGEDAFLVGEAYVTSDRLGPYLDHLDRCFCFELLQAPWEAGALRTVLERVPERMAWILSNHDHPRLPDRVGADNARAAALLMLTLPGTAVVYQGDELGMADGPGRTPPDDRFGRDPYRHPMAWDTERNGSFTTGDPWIEVVRPDGGSVAEQWADPGSMLHLYRDLIALRRTLGPGLEVLESRENVLALRRGEHLVALNVGPEPEPAPAAGELLLHSARRAEIGPLLAPGEGFVARI